MPLKVRPAPTSITGDRVVVVIGFGYAVVEPDPCLIDRTGRGPPSPEWTTAQSVKKCITVSHKLGTLFFGGGGQKAFVEDKGILVALLHPLVSQSPLVPRTFQARLSCVHA